MTNSIFPIRDRVYFLKRGSSYQKYRYKEQGNSFSGRFTKRTIYTRTSTHIIQKLLSSMTLPFERDVWSHAPTSIQQALLFSYSYHEHNKNKKVANVETMNWLALPYFADLLSVGKKRTEIQNVIHPRAWFNAMTMTHGNHKKNLRIGHIHFTYDILDRKEVYCVHWDIGASRFSPTIFIHWLLDDMSS